MQPPAPTLRLFLGLWPSTEVRAALTAHADAWSWPAGVRRVQAERLHVTLHFLGNVPAARLPDLRANLAVPWTGCDIVFDRTEVWPGGLAVLEAATVPPELAHLHRELAQRLRRLDMEVETRPYRPHVTLARKAKGARPPAAPSALVWHAAPGYVLARSPGGGRGYEPVQCFG